MRAAPEKRGELFSAEGEAGVVTRCTGALDSGLSGSGLGSSVIADTNTSAKRKRVLEAGAARMWRECDDTFAGEG
eukprot:6153133-Prymnesium_polylepis.1